MKILYGAPTCAKCIELKNKFENDGVDFKYIDVSLLDQEAIRELAIEHGTSLPIIVEEK